MTSGGDSQDFHAAASTLTRTRNLNDADALSKRYFEPLRDADNTPHSASLQHRTIAPLAQTAAFPRDLAVPSWGG